MTREEFYQFVNDVNASDYWDDFPQEMYIQAFAYLGMKLVSDGNGGFYNQYGYHYPSIDYAWDELERRVFPYE